MAINWNKLLKLLKMIIKTVLVKKRINIIQQNMSIIEFTYACNKMNIHQMPREKYS